MQVEGLPGEFSQLDFGEVRITYLDGSLRSRRRRSLALLCREDAVVVGNAVGDEMTEIVMWPSSESEKSEAPRSNRFRATPRGLVYQPGNRSLQ